MKVVQIEETRRVVREDEARRLLDVESDFGLAEVRLREHGGTKSVELIFRYTRSHWETSAHEDHP